MQSLRYTNILLTVIAVCLIYQCVKFGAPPSVAQAGYTTQGAAAAPTKPVPVQIVGTPTVKVDGTVKTDTTISGTPNSTINPGAPVDVNIVGLGPVQRSLNVTIVGRAYHGSLPVEITNSRQESEAAVPVRVMNPSEVFPGFPPPHLQVEVTNFPKR